MVLPVVLTACAAALGAGLGATGTETAIEGRVLVVSGNCQPTEPGAGGDCKTTPAKLRKVLVYAPPLRAGGFRGTAYAGSREPTLVVRTDARGRYRIVLPPGAYTIVARDDGKPYCNLFTRLACAVRLSPGRVLEHEIRIDHSAV